MRKQPIWPPHLCDTAFWELTARSWHMRQEPWSSRDLTPSFQTLWHFEVLTLFPSTGGCLPAGWVPVLGPDLAFCNRSFYSKEPLERAQSFSDNNLEAKGKKKATCETWVILCLHFAPVTGSLGFSSCPSCGFSARSKQATHLSCLSLSFSFLKWAAHFLRTLVGCNQLGF